MKKSNEKDLVKTNALPSKQKKYLSIKYLPIEKKVRESSYWKDTNDEFDYGERLD